MLKTDGITIRDWHHLITHKINIERAGLFDPALLFETEKFKFFKNDSDLAKKILLERNDYFYLSYFKKLLKEESFVFSLSESSAFF